MTDNSTGSSLDRLRDAVRRTRELTRDRVATGRSHDDADEDTGTIDTDDALGFDPFPLLGALHRAGARAVVMGQVAGIMHGSTELTGDLDLLWDGAPDHAAAFLTGFAEVGAKLNDDDGNPLALSIEAFRLPKVQFSSPNASGDCCTPLLPWGGIDVAGFLGRALTATDRDGMQVHYLRCDDLVTMRRAVGRPKDRRRADELETLMASGNP